MKGLRKFDDPVVYQGFASAVIEAAVKTDTSAAARNHTGPWQTNPSKIYVDIRKLHDRWNTV